MKLYKNRRNGQIVKDGPTLEELVAIARTEVMNRESWPDCIIRQHATPDDVFEFLAERIPAQLGSHRTIRLSSTGDVIQYMRGK